MASSLVVEISVVPVEDKTAFTEKEFDNEDFPLGNLMDYTIDQGNRKKDLDFMSYTLPPIQKDEHGEFFEVTEKFKNDLKELYKEGYFKVMTALSKAIGEEDCAPERGWEGVKWEIVSKLSPHHLLLYVEDEGIVETDYLLRFPVGSKFYIGGVIGYHF